MENLQAMIERYKAEMMKAASRSALPPQESVQPAPPEPAPVPAPAPPRPEPPPASAPSPQPAAPAVPPPPLPPDEPEINPPEADPQDDPLQPIAPEADTYENFLRENTKTGILRVQAYAGRQAVPVPGAQVTVSRTFSDGTKEFASGVTDENGIFDNIVLPAPDKALAEAPTGEAPYATYDIRVTHPGYRTEVYQQVPIFDGIKSIQPVRFLPDRSVS